MSEEGAKEINLIDQKGARQCDGEKEKFYFPQST